MSQLHNEHINFVNPVLFENWAWSLLSYSITNHAISTHWYWRARRTETLHLLKNTGLSTWARRIASSVHTFIRSCKSNKLMMVLVRKNYNLIKYHYLIYFDQHTDCLSNIHRSSRIWFGTIKWNKSIYYIQFFINFRKWNPDKKCRSV